MVEESQPQGMGVCWTLRLWSVAVISILLLSTCFIMSCIVISQFTMDNPNRRLSELHTSHSNLTCLVSDRVWSCCPMNWKLFGSNCYFTSTDSLASWNESEAKCSSMGAHLLVIHSKEEQDFITGILDTSAVYFIGLQDEGHRQWRWVDGTPYNESARKGVCWTLRLWSVAVISILLLSTCFIATCVVTYQFTVDKPSRRLSELHTYHSSLSCFSEGTMVKNVGCCPSHWKSFGSSCYLISTKENFWSISEQECAGMGAHLVVINTEAEQVAIATTFITQQLNESLSYFLGLSDPQGNGKWQWIDNTPFNQNVRFWHPNEPNFSAERCASIVFWTPSKWGWNDVFCDSKRYSICEMKKIHL